MMHPVTVKVTNSINPACLEVTLKGELRFFFKPRPYFWHEMRLSTHREQFGESRHPSEAI